MSNHLFYVVNHNNEQEAILKFFDVSLKNANKKLKRGKRQITCQFEYIQVTNRKGDSLGYGYLWLSNPEVFNMAIGLNPDGSERVTITRKGDPAELQQQLEEALATFMAEEIGQKSWADVQEEEEKIREKYSVTEVREPQKPLIDLEKLTGNYIGLALVPYVPKELDPTISSRVLFCSQTPQWVTESLLYDKFRPFSKRRPEIKINQRSKKRSCTVTFDHKEEAETALAMRAKISLSHDGEDATLIFRHGFI